MNEVLHHVFTASSGTIAMITGISEYSRLDQFLNWAAVYYIENKHEVEADNFFDAVREIHNEYLRQSP